MLFFHDHALAITRLNVYAGLAGLYIIEDEHKKTLFSDAGLPNILGSDRDIPLAFRYGRGASSPPHRFIFCAIVC